MNREPEGKSQQIRNESECLKQQLPFEPTSGKQLTFNEPEGRKQLTHVDSPWGDTCWRFEESDLSEIPLKTDENGNCQRMLFGSSGKLGIDAAKIGDRFLWRCHRSDQISPTN